MTDIDDLADDQFPDINILRADGFDDCAIGIVERCGQAPFLVYDAAKIIQKLVKESDGEMDYFEAQEYFDFNIAGAWVGEGTPGFIDTVLDQ